MSMKKGLVCLLTLLASALYMNVWGAVSYTLEDSNKTLKFTGSGSISSNSGWATSTNKSNVTKIKIEEGVTSISDNMFSGFTKVTQVNLPASLTSIGTDAFLNCSTIVKVYYADTPNKWAGISIANEAAHPFKGGSASDHNFYFYGSESATTILVLTPPITTIKKYAFYNSHFSHVHIPGTVTSIEEKALYCTIGSGSSINCRTAPSLGTSAITSGTNFYIPTGATGYGVSPWSGHTTSQAISGTISETYGAGITWNFDVNGVLTLNATGANKAITFTGKTAYTQYPWSNFRRLINKVVIRGEISELSQTFTYLWGLSEITFNQTTIPAYTTDEAKIAYSSLFNTRDNIKLNIKAASLSDASASNLGSAPYNNARLTIGLSDAAVFADNADNTTLLSNIRSYIDEPFTLDLTRSLSKAYYNTFCSPIPMSSSDITAKFGAGTDIRTLVSSSFNEETEALTLNFSESSLTEIEAGKPYIIKPGSAVANPSFTDVEPSEVVSTPANIDLTDITFYGTLAPRVVVQEEIDDMKFIFLQASNQLNWAKTGTLGGMRAYWIVKNASAKALARRPIMKIGQTATGIEDIQASEGRSKKILRNGQMIIVRDGKEYTVQGVQIR